MMGYSTSSKIVVSPISSEIFNEFDLGDSILLLVSKTVWNSFQLEEVFKPLQQKKRVHLYKHIRPDAPFSDLDRILQELEGEQLTSIIAIGGGSIIDAAKALSVAFEGISYKDIFYGKKTLPSEKIPVLAVPTTAGTGAELSYGAIIYDEENGVKGGIRGTLIQPNAVLLDARLHNKCPFKLKAEVGFDSLTHAVETYVSRKSNPIVRYQSVASIRTILKYLVPACEDNNLEAMEKVAISSTLMGLNLAFSSTCLPHRIQYVIGPMTGTSHAQGLIALYRGWLSHLLNNGVTEFGTLAKDLDMTPDGFVQAITSLKKRLHIDYSLSDLGIRSEQADLIAGKVKGNMSADPSYKDINSITNILSHSF